MTEKFQLVSDFAPAGDQPAAIADLVRGLNEGLPSQVLLGVTGSGKTFTIANVVAQVNRPTLVLAHNKILAAQLYGEFKALFPENAVEYFVSYYDYYQPEAYVPSTDTYIDKDASINDEIDKMRHSATRAILTRRDCIIVASGLMHLRNRLARNLQQVARGTRTGRRIFPRAPYRGSRGDAVQPE